MRSANHDLTAPPQVRLATTRKGGIKHVVDDWSCEMARKRRKLISFCGVDLHATDPGGEKLPVCQRCEGIIRRTYEDIRRRKTLPPENIVRDALNLILQEQESDLAIVIPFRPRKR